jgi:hypothetical protein
VTTAGEWQVTVVLGERIKGCTLVPESERAMTIDPAITEQVAENVTKLVLYAILFLVGVYLVFFRKRKSDVDDAEPAFKHRLKTLRERAKQRKQAKQPNSKV